jgi:hypothetical protein
MGPPLNQERLARLKVELAAIDKWDEDCGRDNTQNTTDEVSYQARQLRRREIMRVIESLTDIRPAA